MKRAATLYIRLFNVPAIETLTSGQPLECTVNGEPNEAKYLKPASLPRTIWVEIAGLRETPKGKIVPDLFETENIKIEAACGIEIPRVDPGDQLIARRAL